MYLNSIPPRLRAGLALLIVLFAGYGFGAALATVVKAFAG